MEHDIPFGNSNRGNGTTFLDFPLFLGIFQWDELTKRVPFIAEPEIPEILTKWKAPLIYHDPSDHGSLIQIRIILKKCALRVTSTVAGGNSSDSVKN